MLITLVSTPALSSSVTNHSTLSLCLVLSLNPSYSHFAVADVTRFCFFFQAEDGIRDSET